VGLAAGDGCLERLDVHVAEHQDLAALGVTRNDRNQPVGVELWRQHGSFLDFSDAHTRGEFCRRLRGTARGIDHRSRFLLPMEAFSLIPRPLACGKLLPERMCSAIVWRGRGTRYGKG
jgi:hypothetical protein